MALISRLAQEITDEEKHTGESQCFIGHEFRSKDLRVKLVRVLERFGLEAYLADHEVTGDYILSKVCRRIMVTRASIVDLTTANPNVYFELGVAIGLNKPVFVVLKRGATVPPLLDSFVKLRFTSYAGLERELVKHMPDWLEESTEHHLRYNTHCHFVNVLCPDRQRISPQRGYLVIDQIRSTEATGRSIVTPDPDLRAELPTALDRFHFTPTFLDEVSLEGDFRLCDYCRALRSRSFSLCHLNRRSSTNVYLLLGLATGLDIPSLMMVHEEEDNSEALFEMPTMLRGLDPFTYKDYVEIGELLADRVEAFLHRLKSRPLDGKRLPFSDQMRRLDLEPVPEVSVLVDAPEVLGQPIEAVIDILGEPQFTDRNDYRLLNEYQVGGETLQVEFHDEVAVFVSCELGSLDLTEDEQALSRLGLSLPTTPPTIDNRQLHLRRWESFEPFGRLTIYYNDDDTIESVTVVTKDAELTMQEEVGTTQASSVRPVLAAIRESLLSGTNESAPMGLPANLYARCRDTLLKCSEFDNSASLQAVFVTGELVPFRDRLPQAIDRSARVDVTIDYLFSVRLSDGRSALSVFLATLRDRYSSGDALRAELEKLHIEIERTLNKKLPSEKLIDIIPEIVKLGDTAALNDVLAITQLLTSSSQQTEVLIALVDAMTQMEYLEGMRRVVEITLTVEKSDIRDRVLETIADAYRYLGEEEKAQQVSVLQEEPAQPAADLALRGMIRILKSDGSVVGTGFVVSNDGLIATSAHVVGSASKGPGERVSIEFYTSGYETQALALPEHWLEEKDVAILQVEGSLPPGVEPLPLGTSEGSAGQSFRALSFTPRLEEGSWSSGEIVGEASSRGQGFLQLRSEGLAVGSSGAPVWNEETGQVVGMVAMFYVKDQHRDTVLAVPAEIVEAARISAESRADMVTKSTTEVIGGGSLVLPFDDLSPYDFERLCLTLVKREGYQQVEHLGATGRPHQGRDIVARRDGDIWAFQCKRMRHFHLTDALSEIESVLSLSEDERPAILVFVTSGDVSARTREEVRTRCAGELMECRFWTKDELEERVSRHPDIVEEFFPSKATLYYTPFQAPPLPSHFVSRPELSEALKTDLLTDEVTTTEPVVVNAVLGMGGVGKSTLAAVLAHDAEVQARFPDGVLWATVGQQPNILSLLMNWIQALEDYDFQPPTIEAASVRLRTLLHDRACLLVLDDVRQSQHVRPFLVDSSRSQILITTRGVTVASQEVGSRIYEMGVMTPEQSLGLLAEHLGRSLDEGEQEKALRLAQAVDYHPLTLQLAAAQINQGASWTEVIYNMQSEMEKHQPREHISHMGSKGMVHVSAGPFLYGDDKQELNVREFWIDRTPVTNAEYARFIAATGHEPPNHWTGGKLPQEIADHPVTQVSWYDAMAYADWAGKRLPTEEEWEKTARGTEGQIYPWGEEPPTSGGCNFGNNVGTTTPVGRYSPQGDSPYGCSDMAGNVWEWTSSSYDTEGDRKVLRGGCWDNEPLHVRSAYRISNTPESRGSVMGFRCVKDSE